MTKLIRRHHLNSVVTIAILLGIAVGSPMPLLSAENTKVQGVIKARSGATLILQTADSPKMVVVLTDFTKVSQVKGVLKARKESMSMAALIPGLPIQVQGTVNTDGQLVAESIKFKGDDLAQAKAIQAGLWETKERTKEQQEELDRHKSDLQAQSQALKEQQEQLTEGQKKIAANKAAIDAAAARFGQLDDYYILDEVTVYFANGKVNVDARYKPQLLELAEKAKKVDAYMVQVIGYASATGSAELNQKLSEDRAHNVSIFLSQQGHIPLMNMLAPGAMGESRQVSGQKSTDAEAQNRRVVVRVLQNKGIAAGSASSD